ncbi:MAG TPA: histidine phosphatase family protein, partial [Fimbriimonadaceae bacterium]|nr:histidine phosphatase family protein [Fimbriimonadaceae bacterium]
FLVRHGAHDLLHKTVVGRAPGIFLNEEGKDQARRAADRLLYERIEAIFSSPRERCVQTAQVLSERLGLPVNPVADLDEIEIGRWAGASFEKMEADPGWQQYNQNRSLCQAPGGESMLEVQARMVRFVSSLCHQPGLERVVAFSHGDPIRAALIYYLGMPIDMFQRLEISPGSVSALTVGTDFAKVHFLNG